METIIAVANQFIIKHFYLADVSCKYDKTFFGIPVWYKYLKPFEIKQLPATVKPIQTCAFDFNGLDQGGNAAVLIGLGIVDILLRLIALVAIGFVVIGGVKYVLSQGEPDRTKSARGTIINALIGLAIAVVAAAIVAFLGGQLNKK